jgi:hypothetical protein
LCYLRTLYINWFEPIHDVIAAMLVTGARTIASPVQVHANPASIIYLLQDTMASGKIDIPVAEIVDTIEEFCRWGVLRFDGAVR